MPGRIALISEHASPLAATGGVDAGGQNVYVASTAKELGALGYDVDVFTRRDDPELPTVVRFATNARVIHIEAGPPRFVRKEDLLPWMSAFAERVLDIASRARDRGNGYALSHAHFFMSGLVARRLREELAIPYVVTFHALGRVRLLHHNRDDFPRERGMLEQMVIDDADAVVAECPQDAADLRVHYDADAARVAMVPCGFSPEEFVPVRRDDARRRLGLPLDRPIVLQLGRMVPRKGVDNVIRAIATAHREHGVDTLLVVVGGESDMPDPERTPEIGRLMRVAADEGIADRVKFVGRRARGELRDFYCACDAFVTTPWYEPFGITPIEAMACGVPVIGARVGGIQYTVQHGRTGFLVEPKDPAELARRLVQVFSDPSIGQLLGRRGRRRAYQLFTWRRVAQQLDALYAAVAGGRAGALEAAALGAVQQAG